MNLEYVQLNKHNGRSFPYEVAGCFNDGFSKHPLLLQEKGTLLMGSGKPILESDAECCALLGVKKLPADVIVQYSNL